MISDASKLALVAVACVLGVLVGFQASSSIVTNPLSSGQTSEDAEQRLLLEEEASNQLVSGSAAGQSLVGEQTLSFLIGEQSPKWQLVIEKVPADGSQFPTLTCLARLCWLSASCTAFAP